MADATQVQRRRGTSTQCDGMTPADAEAIVDQTYNRWRIGDGVKAGGHHQASAYDVQNQRLNYGAAGGTGNAITLTFYPAYLAYTQGMSVEFRAGSNNTTGVTLNIDGLGTKNLYKFSSGALVALVSGDLITGVIYRATYDGTQFQVIGSTGANTAVIGAGAVAQANLKTSTGSFSAPTANLGAASTGAQLYFSNPFSVISPGGEYGFEPSITGSATTCGLWSARDGASSGARYVGWASAASTTVTATQRYVASSPPFDLGDGEAGGFIFLMVDSNGDVVQHYAADVPPWGYNGPTDIRASHICLGTGKKFRKVIKNRNFEQLLDGAPIQYHLEEITNDIKNKDMKLIPHPFSGIPEGHTVVMLDPMCSKLARMIDLQNEGFGTEVTEKLFKYMKIDNEHLKRKCPKNVHVSRVRFK